MEQRKLFKNKVFKQMYERGKPNKKARVMATKARLLPEAPIVLKIENFRLIRVHQLDNPFTQIVNTRLTCVSIKMSVLLIFS